MDEAFHAQTFRGQAQEGVQLICEQGNVLQPHSVQKWFEQYKRELERLNITSAEQIWNCDETGYQDVPKSRML